MDSTTVSVEGRLGRGGGVAEERDSKESEKRKDERFFLCLPWPFSIRDAVKVRGETIYELSNIFLPLTKRKL